MDYFELIVGAIIVIYSLFSSLSKKKKKRPVKQPNRSPIPDQSTMEQAGARSKGYNRTDTTTDDLDDVKDYSTFEIPHNFGDRVDSSPERDPHFSHMEEPVQPDEAQFYESSENRPSAYTENRITLSDHDTHEDDKSIEHNRSLEDKNYENIIGDEVSQDINTPLKVKKVDRRTSKKSTVRNILQDKNALQEGIILKEILDHPVSQRRR